MRVLITGASGFIGGRLLQHLLALGNVQLRAASRIVRDWPDGVEGVVINVTQPATVHAACEHVDAVINLVSMQERSALADPYAALRVTVEGALALASAAAAGGVSRFVQLSTYKVYGNSPSGLVTEETLTKPRSHYAITHRAAEDYATAQHPNAVVFRLANGFGAPVNPEGDCWNLIVNQMCRQAVLERRITITSSGQAWRNFVPMLDVVRALHMAATDLPPGTYNLGFSQSMTVREVAEQIRQICSATFGFMPTVTVGVPRDDEQITPLDFRIEKLLRTGFQPSASFEEEVRCILLFLAQSSSVSHFR